MYKKRKPIRRSAIMMVDALASISLIVLVVAAVTLAARQYAVIRAEQDVRRELRLAAENELHRIRAGLPATATVSHAPPGFAITLTTAKSPGVGLWSGLDRVTVTATRKITARRTASVELSAYMRPGGVP